MPQRPCNHCGEVYDAKRPQSKFCGARCRNRHSRHPELAKVVALSKRAKAKAKADESDETQPSISSTSAAVRQQLIEAERLDTFQGQAALQLASSLDSPSETGSAKAALARQLAATMELAMAGVKRVGDPVDELRARRAKRQGA